MSKALSTHPADFNGTAVQIIDLNNQQWLTGEQIGEMLGYKNPRINTYQLYESHSDEFTAETASVIDSITPGGVQKTRIFSPRGCWMLGMWSQTAKAKQFRQWVLDVLEQNQQQPTPKLTLTSDILEKQLKTANRTICQLQKIAVKVNPQWAQIKRYKEMGLKNKEIGKLLDLYPGTIGKKCREMEAAQLIAPPVNLAGQQQRAKVLHLSNKEAK